MTDFPAFSTRLTAWQKTAGRHDLPWQNSRDPYRIWLSEIMLQQTQVATVIPYYRRFLVRFPDVRALAAAAVDEVMAHWAGLGYYARARNLHRCAQAVVACHAGRFPDQAAALAALPGIGPSTAAAIAVFAFGQRAAILDGNVKRVLCRHFAIDGFPGAAAVHRQLWRLADSLLPEADIEAYTQGLMDLGSGLCTRRRPACQDCPLTADCRARQQGRQAALPTARSRSALPERSATFVLLCADGRILLERRPPSGLWGGLLTPPEGPVALVLARLGLKARHCQPLPPLRHSFTHFRLTLEPVLCEVDAPPRLAADGYEWLALAQAATAGVPTPVGKLLRALAGAAALRGQMTEDG
ncbi:MAG: A/G-specific adenine glycosylase [Azonexus sp.]|nr:A/G-specific adenine glycosylase [Azonexus sp.]